MMARHQAVNELPAGIGRLDWVTRGGLWTADATRTVTRTCATRDWATGWPSSRAVRRAIDDDTERE